MRSAVKLQIAGLESPAARPCAGPSARHPVDYFARLEDRQPAPLSAEAARALDEADRDER